MTKVRSQDPDYRLPERDEKKRVLPPHVRLGLNGAGKHVPRLRLADYYERATAAPPAAVSRPTPPSFAWGMLANDKLGDCVCAAILHAIESWYLDTGSPPPGFTDADAIALYEKIGGYNPSDPSSDQGCDEGTAMTDWEAGLPQTADGVVHELAAVVGINPTDEQEVKIGIDEFDGVFDAIALPVSAQGQAEWDVVGDPAKDPNSQPGSWGGHGTWTREYDPTTYRVVTWGMEIDETGRFRLAYHVQAFALVPKDVQKSGVGPSGVHWDDLLSDISKLPPVSG